MISPALVFASPNSLSGLFRKLARYQTAGRHRRIPRRPWRAGFSSLAHHRSHRKALQFARSSRGWPRCQAEGEGSLSLETRLVCCSSINRALYNGQCTNLLPSQLVLTPTKFKVPNGPPPLPSLLYTALTTMTWIHNANLRIAQSPVGRYFRLENSGHASLNLLICPAATDTTYSPRNARAPTSSPRSAPV